MAKVFLGFQNTTLVGKNDTTSTTPFVAKVPQQNITVFEYNRNPIPPSSTTLSDTIVSDLSTINNNAKLLKLDKTKYDTTKDKGEIVIGPEEPPILLP